MNVRRTSGCASRRALAALVCLATLSACGTRVGGTAIEAGAGGGAVQLSPQTLAQLQPEPPKAAPVAAAVPQSVPAAAATATAKRVPAATVTTGAVVAPAGGSRSGAHASAAATVQKAAAAEPACPAGATRVAIGQIGTFSGVAGPVTAPARTMLGAWAKDVNARGGLQCHPVDVYSADDGGDASRAAALVQEMVSSHHVVAFVASLTPLSISGFRPAVESARIPAVGGAVSPNDSAWFFPDGASIDDLAVGLFKDGVDLGHKRVGLLYCVEAAACTDVDKQAKAGTAKAAGAELVYDAPISIAQPDYTAQCLNARDAKVDLLTLAVDGASISRIVRSCKAVGYHPLIATGGGLLTPAQSADPDLRSFGVASVSAEAPWMLTDTPGLAGYHRALTRWAPDLPAEGVSMMAWTSAMMLESAVAHVADHARSGPITTTEILAGLGAIHAETFGGLAAPLGFTAGEARAVSSGCMFFELLGPNGWTAPHGSKPVCVRG